MRENRINQAISKVFSEAIKPQKNERVLIVGTNNKNSQFVSQCFFDEAKKVTKDVAIVLQNSELGMISETLRLSAMSAPDVIIVTDVERIGDDIFGERVGYKIKNKKYNYIFYFLKDSLKSRVFWFYVNDIDLFCDNVIVDYEELGRISRQLKKEMSKAEKIHITSGNGTDLWVDVSDQNLKPQADFDGTQHKPGSGINIPMGEVLITPTRGKSQGVAVVDGTFYNDFEQKTIHPRKPFRVFVRDGFVREVEITCPEAKEYDKMIKLAEKKAEEFYKKGYFSKTKKETIKKNSRLLSEFAVGVNPRATLVGDFLIDEKIYGTCHFAVGMSYDGDLALFHSDALMLSPEIEINFSCGSRKVIVANRKILL